MSDQAAYTVNEFCAVHRLSRAMLYKLWYAGKGGLFNAGVRS